MTETEHAAPLALRGVCKHFAGQPALDNISLTFPVGTTVLIGPSGCGKSTLLRCLIGLVRPDSGELRFDGDTINNANIERLRRRMGYVIQEGGLFPHLRARDNVILMACYLGRGRAEIDGRVAEMAELVGLNDNQLARYPRELSGGQRQRVSLMRALMLDPDVLLLDEPLGALDPMIRAELQTQLQAIFERLGKTVVLVTHDLAEAAFFSDRIVLMQQGRVVQVGGLDQLQADPASPFVTDFVAAQRHVFAPPS